MLYNIKFYIFVLFLAVFDNKKNLPFGKFFRISMIFVCFFTHFNHLYSLLSTIDY